MQCILLAAGYATRLYPLTKNLPKALLKLGDETIIDMITDKIFEVPEVENVYVVTNARFYGVFCDWANNHLQSGRITVLNDGTTDNSNRLGAIGDLRFVIDSEKIDDEILVMASDNIFGFSLNDFVGAYKEKSADMICAHPIADENDLHSMGVILTDENDKVTDFEEKPQNPKSNLGVPPFYLYKKDTVPLIAEYLDTGNNPDAPGNFIPWLIGRKDVYAYKFDAVRIDIGTPESYKDACERKAKGILFKK